MKERTYMHMCECVFVCGAIKRQWANRGSSKGQELDPMRETGVNLNVTDVQIPTPGDKFMFTHMLLYCLVCRAGYCLELWLIKTENIISENKKTQFDDFTKSLSFTWHNSPITSKYNNSGHQPWNYFIYFTSTKFGNKKHACNKIYIFSFLHCKSIT